MSDIKKILQMQAWERAKGELLCVLATIEKESEGFVRITLSREDKRKRALVEEFIQNYERILRDEEDDSESMPEYEEDDSESMPE